MEILCCVNACQESGSILRIFCSFLFSRMGNFTSSSTVGSSTTCLQYVQVGKCLQISFLQSSYERFRHRLFDKSCIQADDFTSHKSFTFLASVHLSYLDDGHLIPSCLFDVLHMFKGTDFLSAVKSYTKTFAVPRNRTYGYIWSTLCSCSLTA